MKKYLALVFSLMMLCAGYQTVYSWSPASDQKYVRVNSFPETAYQAADVLAYNLTADICRTEPIVYSSFAELGDLSTTSAFGRVLGEVIGSRFAQHGYRILELRLRKDTLKTAEGAGELALSRDIRHIRETWHAQAVITGTYHLIGDKAVVSARVVNTADNSIIASHDFSFSLEGRHQAMVIPDRMTEAKKEEEIKTPKGPLATGAIVLNPSRNTDAKLIQTRLADLGLYRDRIDGIWGKNSRNALRQFKTEHQLPDPEKWDTPTQIRLFSDTNL